MHAIGSKIRNLRLQLGLSQRQLAGKEMTRAFISLVESGRAMPSLRTLSIIAQRLGKPMEYFLGEEYSYEDMAGAILEAARQKVAANEFKSAIPLIHEVLRKSENQQLLAEGYHLLTVCLRCLGRLNEALLACETALEHFRTVGDRRGVTQTYLQIGALAVALEDFPRARQAYEQVLRYSKGLKSLKEDYIEALLHFGNTLLCLGDLDEAVLAYEEAFHESFRQGNLAQMGFAALGVSRSLFYSGRVEGSLKWSQRALDLMDQAKSSDRTLALHFLGKVLLARGIYDEAYEIFQESLLVNREQGFMDRVASVLVDLAWYWIQRGDLLQAKVCCREALHLLDAKDNGIIRGQLYRVLGTIAQKGGISSTLTTSCR